MTQAKVSTEIPLLSSSKIHTILPALLHSDSSKWQFKKQNKKNGEEEMQTKKKQSNRLLIFHGLTIYGAFSTSNLLLSYTRREPDERQREWEKQQRRVRTIYETNFRRLNIELRILGMFFSSSSFHSHRWPLRCSQVAYSFYSTFEICSLFHFVPISKCYTQNTIVTLLCTFHPLRNGSFIRVREEKNHRKNEQQQQFNHMRDEEK